VAAVNDWAWRHAREILPWMCLALGTLLVVRGG
jgi:hypothetical protein